MASTTLLPIIKRGRIIADTFEVVNKIGEGGCGSVYRCKHKKRDDAIVAVKVLDQPDDAQRFKREGQVLRQTRHPNVVRLFGRGLVDDRPYLAMEFVAGGSVRDLLSHRRKLAPSEAGWILVQAVRGLRAAGTVHRDLKPENLLVDGPRRATTLKIGMGGEGTIIKVADFGLAKSVGSGSSLNLTHTGQIMGTPVYMSPEQCKSSKKVSFKTDVYAIGIMLFEFTTGKLPFDASNVYDVMKMQCEQEPKYPKRMDVQVEAICRKCLAKKVGERYRNLAALEKDLALLAGVESEPAGNMAWLRWGLRLVSVAAVVAAGYWSWQRWGEAIRRWIGF